MKSWIWIGSFFLLFGGSISGQQVAQFVGHCNSFYLGPHLDLVYGETLFTTPDLWPECPPGTECCQRLIHEGAPRFRGSGEAVRSKGLALGAHEVDFYQYRRSQTPTLHGRLGLTLPDRDDDQNGVWDALQVGRAFSEPVSAKFAWTSGEQGFRIVNCSLQRSANSTLGTYEIDLPDGFDQRKWRGIWSLVVLRGTVQYQVGISNEVTLKLEVMHPDGSVRQFQGDASVFSDGSNGLKLLPMSLAGGSSGPLFIEGGVLIRDVGKSRFLGEFAVAIPNWFLLGPPLSKVYPCPEAIFPAGTFRTFQFEVLDQNDLNGNGIPDLVDNSPPLPTKPVVSRSPPSRTVRRGESTLFQVVALGEGPLSYQWYRGETAILGATKAAYLISSVIPGDAGDYWALVANSHGSAWSGRATLAVARESPEPKIVSSIQPVNLKVGDSTVFSVVADGEPALNYTWVKDGRALGPPGALTQWRVTNVTPADIGNYSVFVRNGFGAATSGPVALTLVGYPPRPTIRAVRLVARGPEIDCSVQTGVKYRLDTSLDLFTWTPVNQFTATNLAHTVKHNFATATVGRFYRLAALSPAP